MLKILKKIQIQSDNKYKNSKLINYNMKKKKINN